MDNNKTTESDRLIHTPSTFARQNLLYAQETGRLKSLKQHSCVRENLDSYLFFVVLDGEGMVSTGGKDYKAVKGDTVLLDCRRRYSHISSADNPWTIRWVHFNGSMPKALFSIFEEGNQLSPVFTPANGTGLYEEILDSLAESFKTKSTLAEIEQSTLIEKILVSCIKDVATNVELTLDKEDNDLDKDEFASLRESVNLHMDENHLERILSIQYGLQPEELSRIFLEKYGISLEAYIVNRKLNKVKELLRFTIKSVDEIMEESGFSEEKELRQLFMDSEQMSPEDYRKRWAQWIKS